MRGICHGFPKRSRSLTALLSFTLILAACGSSDPVSSPSTPGSSPTTSTAPPSTTSTPATTAAPPPTTLTTTTTTTTTAAPGVVLSIPQSAPPTIDGVAEDGEWEGATTHSMSDGATVHLMQSDDILYVGVAGDEIGAVNVVIKTDDTVSILHSSAALGSAVYTRDSTSWVLSHGFDWCCRSTSDESARSTLYDTEGWQANIGFTGNPGEVEYAIALPWEGAAVAISSIRDADDKGFWPIDLSDEARDQLLGVPPAERGFNIEEWVRLAPTG